MTEPAVCVIMAKQPEIGRTKTRLSPPLSLPEAARLYEALLRDTIDLVADQSDLKLALAITPPGSFVYFKSIAPPDSLLLPVEGADIGDCLRQVFDRLSSAGYPKVLALNSDGPSLPAEYLRCACLALQSHDLVLGPGHDGGYYLVGMAEPHLGVFDGIEWSTGLVLQQTLQRARKLNLRVSLTPEWYDVDTVNDLRTLAGELDQIIPERLLHTREFLSTFDLSRLGLDS